MKKLVSSILCIGILCSFLSISATGTMAKVYADESTLDTSTYNGSYFTVAVYNAKALCGYMDLM